MILIPITPADITNDGIALLLAEAAEGFKEAILTPENIAAYRAGTLDLETRENVDAIFKNEPDLQSKLLVETRPSYRFEEVYRVVRRALEELATNPYECLAHAAAPPHQPADQLLYRETKDRRASIEVFIRQEEGKNQRVALITAMNEKMTGIQGDLGIQVNLFLNDQTQGTKRMQQFAHWWEAEWELPEESGFLTIKILPHTEAESEGPDTDVIPPATQ
jgi:hypothetical protein